MMKKIYLISLLCAFFCVSCDDFLTEMPKHEQTIENVVTDYSSAKNIVNGMYSEYEYSSNLGGYIYTNLATQTGLWPANSMFEKMAYYQGNEGITSSIWQDLYKCINGANAAIFAISAADASKFPSDKAKDALIAEARCFRGFMNLQLMWYFAHWFDKADSPYGIIYRDQPANLTNLMVDRSSVGDSYQYIIDDLEYAENNLGAYETPRYVSKEFAKVMHAKLLLARAWEGDYAKALALVQDVMDTAPAIFKMESNIDDLYSKAWDSNELLFCRYLGDAAASAWGSGSYEYPYSAGLFDNKEFADIPTEWLEEDPRHDYIIGEAYGPQQWQVDAGVKGTVLTKLYREGRGKNSKDKFCSYVFRYAELYLMKAELLARTNPSDIASALKPLNDMRSQYLIPKLEPVPMPTTYQELMDAIFKEYVVTLFMENETEWFASIRFEKDGSTWLKKLKGNDISYTTDQYCWPIPDDEIKAHDNEIIQNPGLGNK